MGLETQVSSNSALRLFLLQQRAHFHFSMSMGGLLPSGPCSRRPQGRKGVGLCSHTMPGVAQVALSSPPGQDSSTSACGGHKEPHSSAGREGSYSHWTVPLHKLLGRVNVSADRQASTGVGLPACTTRWPECSRWTCMSPRGPPRLPPAPPSDVGPRLIPWAHPQSRVQAACWAGQTRGLHIHCAPLCSTPSHSPGREDVRHLN